MAINQVLMEGMLRGNPGAQSIDWGAFAYFEIIDDRGQTFPCRMWLGHRSGCHCRTGDRVLALGHLLQNGGEVRIETVSLRKLAKQTWPPLAPARDAPEPDCSQDEIPY
jgi:hypothetical protein